MHVIAVHDVKDPKAFAEGLEPALEKIPSDMTLHSSFPSQDGAQAVCVWEGASVDDVKSFVDGVTEGIADNKYFSVADEKAINLPQASAATA